MEEVNGRVELYGESPSRPLFSAAFDAAPERAIALACAELRLDPAVYDDGDAFVSRAVGRGAGVAVRGGAGERVLAFIPSGEFVAGGTARVEFAGFVDPDRRRRRVGADGRGGAGGVSVI